jgi:hypothetical protein
VTEAQELRRQFQETKAKLLLEKQRRATLPINLYTPDATPDRDQMRFHSSAARYRIGFGGNRAGKSVMTAYEAAAWARGCHRFQIIPPGPKVIYVISAEYRTLYQGIYRHLHPNEGGMKFVDPKWIAKEGPKIPGASVPLPSYLDIYASHTPNGAHAGNSAEHISKIWFISGDGGEQARKKMQAAAVDLAIIDEEIPESIFQELQMRLLDNDGRLAVSATMVRSEEWLMNLEDRANEGDPTVCLVQLNSASSKHLPQAAKDEIYAGLTSEEYAVRVEGKSRRSFGLTYPDFNSSHIFDFEKEFPDGFPDDFLLISGNDPGWRVHAVLYGAIDPYNHTIYFYREHYFEQTPLHKVAETMAESEGYELVPAASFPGEDNALVSTVYARRPLLENPEKFYLRLIDPAAFRKSDAGQMGVAEQLAAFYDTPCGPANNDIQSGIQAVNKLLSINPNTGRPHIQVDHNLLNFFRERRKYRYKRDTSGPNSNETKAEPVRKEDHLMDIWRYICMFGMAIFSGEQPHRRANMNNHNVTLSRTHAMADQLERHAHDLRTKGTISTYVGIV